MFLLQKDYGSPIHIEKKTSVFEAAMTPIKDVINHRIESPIPNRSGTLDQVLLLVGRVESDVFSHEAKSLKNF